MGNHSQRKMASSVIEDLEPKSKSKGAAMQKSGRKGEKALDTIRNFYERPVNNDNDRFR